MRRHDLGGWLNAIIGTIDFFKTSQKFRNSPRMKAADAWTLWTIYLGLSAASGGAVPAGSGGPWEKFFDAYLATRGSSDPPISTLKRLWGQAEQFGVNVAADFTEHIHESDRESFVFDAFKYFGDVYRQALIHGERIPVPPGLRNLVVDPRRDAPALKFDEHRMEQGLRQGYDVSNWFSWLPAP